VRFESTKEEEDAVMRVCFGGSSDTVYVLQEAVVDPAVFSDLSILQ
jgi:hypothetical protein